MTSIKLFGASLVRSAIALAPVSAQEAIQAPGAYSFYHPNADVLDSGVRQPSDAMAQSLRSDAVLGTQMSVRSHRARAAAKRY